MEHIVDKLNWEIEVVYNSDLHYSNIDKHIQLNNQLCLFLNQLKEKLHIHRFMCYDIFESLKTAQFNISILRTDFDDNTKINLENNLIDFFNKTPYKVTIKKLESKYNLTKEEQLRAIELWQMSKEYHPLTCGNCRKNLKGKYDEETEKVILYCDCSYIQKYIPEVIFKNYFRQKRE